MERTDPSPAFARTDDPPSPGTDDWYDILFGQATLGMVLVGPDGSILRANPFAERLFGYDPGELSGRSLDILVPEALCARHAEHMRTYFEHPRNRPMGLGNELFARRKNGDPFPVEISLTHHRTAQGPIAVAFITDITARWTAELELKESEQRFRSMADTAPVMIWVSGIDGGCTWFNRTWLEFVGSAMEEQVADGWTRNVHPQDLDGCLQAYRSAFDARRPFSITYRLRHSGGQYRWILDNGAPRYSGDDHFAGYIGSAVDITERVQAEEGLRDLTTHLEERVRDRTNELQATLAQASELSERKSRFVSMASHELRTPLGAILLSTQLMETYASTGDVERCQRHLRRVKVLVKGMTEVLNDFLSLEKLEQGQVDIVPVRFDLPGELLALIEQFELVLKPGQCIAYEHAGEADVTLDRKLLHNVLLNLLSNAIKYSELEIGVKSEVRGSSVMVRVEDHGIGIPQAEQGRLFGRFFRASNVGDVRGTGLGLTIVQRYVQLMGGTIEVASTEGVGTNITVRVPEAAPADAQDRSIGA
ncbi:MAG: PAS domain-containing sensor histidine kinase [Bacteroidetes bacterium]|nr:PAS domain-containing sensor histidine kinase [Bacteroidota bacterium]